MQAPIGPAATPDLVVAVSSSGGLGSLAASWTRPDRLREQVREIARRTGRPFCVNLVLAFDQRERIALLAEERVPVVSLSWGVDPPAIARLRDAGSQVLVQVGDPEAAERAVAAGADALIVQGTEAGGHVEARAPLLDLLGALRDVPVPLIAAGGITAPAAVRAALDAGASGIAAGTAYLAAIEADVHPVYRDRVLRARGTDTVLTGLFDGGWPDAPHRVLRNATVEACEAAGRRPQEGEQVATRGRHAILRYSDAQPTRDTEGDVAAMALYAGSGVGEVRAEEPAADITRRLLRAAS